MDDPAHTVLEGALDAAVTAGTGFTFTVIVEARVQPFADVPVTVYVVVAVGLKGTPLTTP